MRIALDVMGGDIAPAQNLLGAKQALALFPQIERLYLVGPEATVREEMAKHGLQDARCEIVNAPDIVLMTDSAVKSVRQKKNSSINVSVELVKQGTADAVVSAGHTGAGRGNRFDRSDPRPRCRNHPRETRTVLTN